MSTCDRCAAPAKEAAAGVTAGAVGGTGAWHGRECACPARREAKPAISINLVACAAMPWPSIGIDWYQHFSTCVLTAKMQASKLFVRNFAGTARFRIAPSALTRRPVATKREMLALIKIVSALFY